MPVQRLLLVEDDPTWQECLGHVARAEGCDVTLASDGAEALCHLQGGSRPDLILLDLLMPRMDGWEFYGRLRTDDHLRCIPVLMMSIAGGQDWDLSGVVGFLRKTSQPEENLLHELREQLRQLRVPPPEKTTGPYALRFEEETAAMIGTLPPPLRHAVRVHLHRAAELVGTELPLSSTWLMALPGSPPSLLMTVEGVRVVLEVNDTARTLTVSTTIIPTYLSFS